MPSISIKTNSDEWQRWAVKHANIILRGPGSPHGRVEALKQAALVIAAENFTAGKSEGAIEAAKTLGTNSEGAMLVEMQPILLAMVPEKPEGYGAVELAQAAADEISRLRAAGPAAEPVAITDADLTTYMKLTDVAGSALQQPVRALCMEVAKLRMQLKAKA